MRDWLDMVAAGIVSRYRQWEGEAGQIAQYEQNTEAGDAHLHECLATYLRWMQANHSRLLPAARIALQAEEFRQGKRRRGWDLKFMETELRAAIEEAEYED